MCSISFNFEVYTATRAEHAVQKSRTEDLREDGADQMWRGHVLGEEEYLNVQDECVPAGKTCETRTVHGARPCEDAYEADSESQVSVPV